MCKVFKKFLKRHLNNKLDAVNEHLYYFLITTEENKKKIWRELVGNENKPYVIDHQNNVYIIVSNEQIE